MVLVGMGCTASSKTGNAINTNPSFIKYGTLQGKIMDALTGDAIGGDDLEIYFIQGTDKREPDKLIKDADDTLMGEYAFDSIPVGLATAGANELIFKLVVIKDDYQRFEANIAMTAAFATGTAGGATTSDINYTNEVFNTIGNIYLYPLGSSAGDVTVYVYSPQGEPIENANVLLRQNVTANNTVSYIGNRLVATAGLYPSLTATTDSSGIVTFDNTDLVLGGSYSVVVEALTFEGQQLAAITTAAFISGVNSETRVVNMTAITNSLVATSASNSIPGTITADGSLVITFNQPVIVDTDPTTMNFSATATHGTLKSPAVKASLSSDGMTLTLTPDWTTGPATTDKGVTITYTCTGGVVYLKNSQAATTYTLFGGGNPVVNITTGNNVSGVVQMASQ